MNCALIPARPPRHRFEAPRVWASVVALLVYPTCTPDDDPAAVMVPVPDVEVRYQTKYLDIAPLSDVPVCAGTLVMMDDHVDHVLATLGLDFEDRIPVYLSREGELDLKTWCSTEHPIGGCYAVEAKTIFTTMYGLYHEVVHAITISKGRFWWQEGVAHALSFHERYSTPDFRNGWSPLRGESGHLARWIIEHHGGETFMDLFKRTPRNADQATVEKAVRKVLGQDFDHLLSEYAETAPYIYPDHLACYVARGTVGSPWVDGYWAHDVVLDCDQPDTFSSGDSDDQRMQARIPVTIPSDGYFHFIADDPAAELTIQPCLTEPAMQPIPSADEWPIGFSSGGPGRLLQAGPHVLVVSVPPGAPVPIRLAGYPEVAEHRVP